MPYGDFGKAPGSLGREVVSYATMLMLVSSVCLNIVQARKLGVFDANVTLPAPGTVAKPINATTLSGHQTRITFGDLPTVLYYFSPDCKWCDRNWDNVKAAMRGTEGRYRFIGLSTSAGVEGLLAARGVKMDVYTGIDAAAARDYSFKGTPHTVVVSQDGHVMHSWSGAYVPLLQPEIQQTLGVMLPGVSPPAAHTLSLNAPGKPLH